MNSETDLLLNEADNRLRRFFGDFEGEEVAGIGKDNHLAVRNLCSQQVGIGGRDDLIMNAG